MVLLQTRQHFTLHLSIVCIFTPIERNPCIYLEFLSDFSFSVGGREKLSMIVTLRWGNVTAGLPSSLKCCVPENTASEQIAVFYNFFHLKKFLKYYIVQEIFGTRKDKERKLCDNACVLSNNAQKLFDEKYSRNEGKFYYCSQSHYCLIFGCAAETLQELLFSFYTKFYCIGVPIGLQKDIGSISTIESFSFQYKFQICTQCSCRMGIF